MDFKKMNPLKQNINKLGVAELKIEEGKAMQAVDEAKKELTKREAKLQEIRNLIKEKE